ncbi:MAG TPA: hypothetical protein PKK26_05080 [Candidatus Wallbacteria bacterium]|nr:hypothetical protein [Candidatus Wallbacteria bacterium]
MNRSLIIVLSLVFSLFLFMPAFAASDAEDTIKFEVRIANQMIIDYWQATDLFYQLNGKDRCDEGCAEKYQALVKKIDSQSKELSSRIIRKMNKKDLNSLKNFSDFYKTKQHYERQPLYLICAPIIEKVKSDILSQNKNKNREIVIFESVEQFTAEYFPGYGYSEPGFEYRRGKELSSEFLHAYWQDEIKVVETAKHFEGTIEFKLAAELAAKPGLANFQQIGEPFKVDIGGHIILAVKVSFDTRTQITTSSKKKYAATKVWFELLRRKKGSFSSSTGWAECGKTYEMHDFYTNEEVISEVKFE